jgi:uncharacterized membrane protein YecN with MAPEG domain
MNIAVICVALLGLLVVGLGFAVSLTRGKTNTFYSFNPNPTDPLYKMVRAHGNTTEYAPALAVMIFALGTLNPAPWMVWCMGLATFSRYALALGIILSSSMEKAHPLRLIGAMGTYIFGIALAVALLMKSCA